MLGKVILEQNSSKFNVALISSSMFGNQIKFNFNVWLLSGTIPNLDHVRLFRAQMRLLQEASGPRDVSGSAEGEIVVAG